jgi:hypothetical protein
MTSTCDGLARAIATLLSALRLRQLVIVMPPCQGVLAGDPGTYPTVRIL